MCLKVARLAEEAIGPGRGTSWDILGALAVIADAGLHSRPRNKSNDKITITSYDNDKVYESKIKYKMGISLIVLLTCERLDVLHNAAPIRSFCILPHDATSFTRQPAARERGSNS